MAVCLRAVALALLVAVPALAAAQASSGSFRAGGAGIDRLPAIPRLAPGLCALWYPDRPADGQPPPGDCNRVSSVIPPGARLLIQPAGDERHVQVITFDARRRDGVASIDVYDAMTGERVGPGDGARHAP